MTIKLFQGDPWNVRQNNIFQAIIDNYSIDFLQEKQVLSIGCGYGDIELKLLDFGIDLTLSDARQEYLDFIKEEYPNVKTKILDLDNEWTENYYDIILCIGVLYHVARPDILLIKICNSCDYLFLETEYLDTKNPWIMTSLVGEQENKANHNINQIGARPSHGMIERVILENNMKFKRLITNKYNSIYHLYDVGILETHRIDPRVFRGMWCCKKQ